MLPRNYNSKVIDSQFDRIRQLSGGNYKEKRNQALKKRKPSNKKEKQRVIAPMDYNPKLPKISEVFNKHFKGMVFKKPELKATFPSLPMAAPNLRKLICKSSLHLVKRGNKYSRKSQKFAAGWKKCGKGSTTCCPYTLPQTNQVQGQVTGYNHKIKESVNCETSNCYSPT